MKLFRKSPIHLNIKEGAIVVSDAHYSAKNPHFLDFLKAIESKEIKTPQLILLGDIFDTLFYEIKNTLSKHHEAIELLKKISIDTELIYFEGNHDFNLKNIFTRAKVIELNRQPLLGYMGDKRVYLAHGDWGSSYIYMIYSMIIRNRYIQKILNFLNKIFSNKILSSLERYLQKKDDCKEFKGFEDHIQERFNCATLEDFDYMIEGHFHQNRSFHHGKALYINLASFACNQRYFIVESNQEFLKEVEFKAKESS